MPDDPIFVALELGRPITREVLELARNYRFAQINERWAEIRFLERLLLEHPDVPSVLVERDPPFEVA